VYVELPIVLWNYENNFHKLVLYGTTKILKNQFKGKHSETKECAKPNVSEINSTKQSDLTS
jgi:hypothetical protein